MKLEKFIARRYLKAKRKQAFIGVISIFTFLGITVGVAALNLSLAVHNGMRKAFLESLIGETGLIYIDDGRWEEGGFTLPEVNDMVQALGLVKSVEHISFIHREYGLITTSSRRSAPTQFFGIVPQDEVKLSPHLEEMVEGNWESLEPQEDQIRPGIALGRDLARRLGVGVGDTVQVTFLRMSSPSLLTQNNRLKQRTFQVAGIYQTGSSDIDGLRTYIDLGVLAEQLEKPTVQVIQVKLKGTDLLDASKTIVRSLPEIPPYARVYDLRDANQSLLGALALEKWGTTLIISLIIMVAALNLISALIMLIMEKNRDIGIMRAMGATRRMIIGIFLRQGMSLSVLGTVCGTILGVVLAILADHFQIIELNRDVYEVLKYLPFKLDSFEIGAIAVGSLAISFLSSLYPAYQAASLDPVEALRYE